MIRNFHHKGLERFFLHDDKSGVQPKQEKRIRRILTKLDAATEIKDMNAPGYNLHKLKGEYKGYYAVKVDENYRIIFQFENGDALNVDYLDYH